MLTIVIFKIIMGVLSLLQIWKDYLDFQKVDAWTASGKSQTDEERNRDESWLYGLLYCAMLSNMIEKVRN